MTLPAQASLDDIDLTLPPIRTDLDAAKRDLEEYGLTRVAGAFSEAERKAALERLNEQAAGEDACGTGYHDASEDDPRTGPNQRVFNLINKGAIFRQLVENPTMTELMSHVLGPDFLISSFNANIAHKGGAPMRLHVDQSYMPPETPYAAAVNCSFLLEDFTEENGATRLVPRSHLWDRRPEGCNIPTVAGTGPAGTIMLFEGRLWHGTGANRTDKPRPALLCYCCRPFVRPQENSLLSLAPEVLAQCSETLRARLGFKMYGSLGMISGTRPGNLLDRPKSYVTELKP